MASYAYMTTSLCRVLLGLAVLVGLTLLGPVPTLMTPAAMSPYGAVIGISVK